MTCVAELAASYTQHGYVILEALFSQERMVELDCQLERYCREMVPRLPAADIVYEADGKTVRNLWRMEKHDPYFASLAQDPIVLGLVSELLSAPPVLMAVETFCKPAHVGSAVPYHQDNAYFNHEPPEVLTLWVALDDSTPDNGCLIVAEGTHRLGLVPHRPSGVAGNSQVAADLPEGIVSLERRILLKRGGASIHHCLTLHRSEANRSERPRRGLLLVYRSQRAALEPGRFARYRAELTANQRKGAGRTQ